MSLAREHHFSVWESPIDHQSTRDSSALLLWRQRRGNLMHDKSSALCASAVKYILWLAEVKSPSEKEGEVIMCNFYKKGKRKTRKRKRNNGWKQKRRKREYHLSLANKEWAKEVKKSGNKSSRRGGIPGEVIKRTSTHLLLMTVEYRSNLPSLAWLYQGVWALPSAPINGTKSIERGYHVTPAKPNPA